MNMHKARTETCRPLRLAAIALACMLPAAHAEWNAGAFTNAATYTATGNWVGGVIDDVIGPATTIVANPNNDDARFTWTFAVDHETGAGGIVFDYTPDPGGSSPNLILAGSGATPRTLTLNGDFYWDQGGRDESGIIGKWTASERLNLDLGGGNRAFVMVGQVGSSHGLRIWNNISNGGVIFDFNSPINQGVNNAGAIIYDSTDFAGTTEVRSGLLRVRNTPSWATVQTSGSIANSQRIEVGNNTRKLRFQGSDSYGSPAQLEIGDNVSGNLNRVGDSATVALDSGWIRFRHGNAAAAGGTENIGTLELSGFSVLEAQNNHASQSYTVQTDAFTRPARGTARIGLSSPGGGAVALNLDTAPPTIGGGGLPGATDISIVPFLTGFNTLVTYNGATGLRALNTSTEFVNGTVAATFMAAADDDNVKIAYAVGGNQTTTLTGNKTVNALVIVNQGGGATTTLGGSHTLTVTSGAVLFDGPAGAAYSDFLNVQTLAFGAAEGVISVQNVRGDQRKEVNAIITGSGGVTFSSDQVNSNNSGNNGRLVINGANSYTGPTTFTKGLFHLGANRIPDASVVHVGSAASVRFSGSDTIAGLTGSGHLNNNAGTVLMIDNAVTNDFSGEIAGTIAIAKAGSGTQILSGTNTYTGATTIHAGTLRIGDSGVLGSGSYAGAITNNGTLAYASGANQTLSGAISGTGALHKAGSGTLTLSGANTCAGATVVQAGVLELTLTNALASATALDIRSGGEVRLSFTGTSVIRSLTVNGVTKPRGIYAAASLPGLTGTAGAFVETLEPPPTGTLIAIR